MKKREFDFSLKNNRILFAVCATAVFLGLSVVPAIAEKSVEMPHPFHQNTVVQQRIAEQWGVEILSLRRSAANYMLDFRYKVLDAEKSKPIFNRKTVAYLVDQASGHRFAVPNPPKTGPLRSSNVPQVGRNYFTFFANPGQYIQPGNKVTVIIGDFRAENIVVE